MQLKFERGNIFEGHPAESSEELFPFIRDCSCTKATIEHIVSYSHPTPKDNWYDQDTAEYCILMRGEAVLKFKNEEDFIMKAGSYAIIPAHLEHRVDSVSQDAIWLAFHLHH